MIYDYHFVLTKEMKSNIVKLSKKLKKNISKTIIFIIKKMYPVLDRYYFFSTNNPLFDYNFIKADSDIHVYFNEMDYRKIRQIHNNMYSYSMAGIIRRLLEIFFINIGKHGITKFLKILKRYEEIYLKKAKNSKHWEKYNKNKQMSYSSNNLNHFKLIFSINYTLLGFEFQ